MDSDNDKHRPQLEFGEHMIEDAEHVDETVGKGEGISQTLFAQRNPQRIQLSRNSSR